jgi:hypothetical protein
MPTIDRTIPSRDELIDIERILDKIGVRGVLRALAEIAWAKESHVLETWQDRALARLWTRVAQRLDKLASTIADPYLE